VGAPVASITVTSTTGMAEANDPEAWQPIRVYAGYFGLQAVAGIAFWALVATVSPIRHVFEMWPKQHAVTNSFLFADLVIGIAGSAAAGIGLWSQRRWAPPLAIFVAGGMEYATIYLVGWVAFTGVGGGLLALMVVPSTLSVWAAVQAWRLTRP
jgi:hypothetical protein